MTNKVTVHRYHPERTDPPGAILFDDCERCDEHISGLYPLGQLDSNNLRRLAEIVDGVNYAETQNDAVAARKLMHMRTIVEKAFS